MLMLEDKSNAEQILVEFVCGNEKKSVGRERRVTGLKRDAVLHDS